MSSLGVARMFHSSPAKSAFQVAGRISSKMRIKVGGRAQIPSNIPTEYEELTRGQDQFIILREESEVDAGDFQLGARLVDGLGRVHDRNPALVAKHLQVKKERSIKGFHGDAFVFFSSLLPRIPARSRRDRWPTPSLDPDRDPSERGTLGRSGYPGAIGWSYQNGGTYRMTPPIKSSRSKKK